MRRLIQSEFKKIFKSKVNIVLLLILFIFNGYRTYQVYHQPLQYRTDIVMKDENGNPIRIPKMTYYTTDTGGGVAFGTTTETAASTVVIGGTGVNEDGSISIYAMTQEQVDQILNLINTTTAVYGYDESILNIISDEAAAYFAGEKSLDDTANMIQSRVNLYVAEQS